MAVNRSPDIPEGGGANWPIVAFVYSGHSKDFARKLYKTGADRVYLVAQDLKVIPVTDAGGGAPPRIRSLGTIPSQGYYCWVGVSNRVWSVLPGEHRHTDNGARWTKVELPTARGTIRSAKGHRKYLEKQAAMAQKAEAKLRAASEAIARQTAPVPFYIPQALR